MIDTLVLSSGGILGIAHIGVLEYLRYHDILQNIKYFAGCSVGSLICLYQILGYSFQNMLDDVCEKQIFPTTLTSTLSEHIISNILKHVSVLHINVLINHLEEIVKKKTEHLVTFKQLYEITKKEFTVVAVHEKTHTPKYFNVYNTPDVYVHLAVAASCAIPFVFNPVVIENEEYSDGVSMDPFPVKYMDTPGRSVLGIWLSSPDPTYSMSQSSINATKIMNKVIKHLLILTKALHLKTIESLTDRCLTYELHIDIPMEHPLKTPDQKTIMEMFQKGYDLLENKPLSWNWNENETPENWT